MRKKTILILLAAVVIGCGNSPSTTEPSNSTNASNVTTAQNDSATGGGKVASSPAANNSSPPAPANAGKKIVEVKFPKGATEASYTDSFVGYGLIEYELVANADQQMTVEILRSDDNRASFTILHNELLVADDASEVTGWSGVLPEKSKYTISVGQARAFARRDNKAVKFTLRIRIV